MHGANYGNEMTNLYKRTKVSYRYRWSLDGGLVPIPSCADRELVVTLRALFVAQRDSAYT